LLAIGLPGCVTRAARLHPRPSPNRPLVPDPPRPSRPLTRAEQLCPSRIPLRLPTKQGSAPRLSSSKVFAICRCRCRLPLPRLG
jgi:hypothetical protein